MSEVLALVRELAADVRQDEHGVATFSDSWSALHAICQDTLSGAAEILDNKTVTRVVARESRREYWMIESANARGTAHTCVPGFCTCLAYCMGVASKPDAPCCKHELAVLLARPLGKELCREMEDAEWATKFSHALTHPMITYDPKVAATGDALPSRPALMP